MNKSNGITLTCEDVIDEAVASRGEDFQEMIEGMRSDCDVENDDAITRFDEYGLSLSWMDQIDGEMPFLQFQLSWGGPSEEIRFYPKNVTGFFNGTNSDLNEIYFVYKDWFDHAKRDISGLSWAVWLRDYFQETFYFGDVIPNS